ncbi:MAG: hypothetical protein GTN81_03100 [Proteobacteria bacterium]|nr:hypothetical protein [Pseudomonadota bacterium]
MELSSPREIEEVFVIKTRAIDFLGVMVKEKQGKSMITGRVCFQDGTAWHFQSQSGDPPTLRGNLISLCETISAVYGTETFRLRFQEPIAYEELIRVTRETERRMAHA